MGHVMGMLSNRREWSVLCLCLAKTVSLMMKVK